MPDVYFEYPWHFLNSSNSSAVNVVGGESRLNVANQDTFPGVKGHIHAVRYRWAVLHAEVEVSGVGVGQKTRDQQIFTFFTHKWLNETRWSKEISGICNNTDAVSHVIEHSTSPATRFLTTTPQLLLFSITNIQKSANNLVFPLN